MTQRFVLVCPAHARIDLLNIRRNLGLNQLRAGVAKITQQIEDHECWIADPTSKLGVEQRTIYEAVLEEKKSGKRPGDS